MAKRPSERQLWQPRKAMVDHRSDSCHSARDPMSQPGAFTIAPVQVSVSDSGQRNGSGVQAVTISQPFGPRQAFTSWLVVSPAFDTSWVTTRQVDVAATLTSATPADG